MRSLFLSVFIIGIFGWSGCKPKDSELKATAGQRTQLKECIATTILQAFASEKPDPRAVLAFANDMAQKAPSSNDKALDPAFEEYITGLGCDPTKVGSRNSMGTRIVVEWSISPFNPNVPKDALNNTKN